jgi:hypothetical protein
MFWAAAVLLALGVLAYLAGPGFLSGFAEIAAVAALFTLVCAIEAWSRE